MNAPAPPATPAPGEGEGTPDEQAAERLVREVLSVSRAHTGLDVAFLSRVADQRRTFAFVDDDPWFSPLAAGTSQPLDESYCGRVLDGRLPNLVVDARREPAVRDLAVTHEMPIGSHLSVPVLTPDGDVFGTLCCFAREVHTGLTQRHVDDMRLFAAVISRHLEPLVARHREDEEHAQHIARVLDDGGPQMALQPVVDLTSGTISGFEALARFPATFGSSPPVWFSTADRLGMGGALEASAVHRALRLLDRIPSDATLSVNVSAPALLGTRSIADLLVGAHTDRLVLELTEHHRLGDPERLSATLSRLREHGVRVAIDDAGSGYAGLERILRLAPEIVKLDRSLVDGIAGHPGRQAMCEAMVGFTGRTGAHLVAEGVETQGDLDTLVELGVSHAQGYLLGRPAVWPDAL